MPFMQRQITQKSKWLQVETNNGTVYIPSDVIAETNGVSNATAEEVSDDVFPIWFQIVSQFCESEPISWEWIEGFGCRLSAPGYMDCTEWTVFPTVKECEDHLNEYYPEESDDDSEA